MNLSLPNEGIELLYTANCLGWQEALINLQQALRELKIKDKPKLIKLETIEQARLYNFFASPTIHIDGVDIDPQARRISRRGLGYGRPYWHQHQARLAPSVEMIKTGLQELYIPLTIS